jgi:hypothetical protein
LPLCSSGVAYSGIRRTVFIISVDSREISMRHTTRNFTANLLGEGCGTAETLRPGAG